MVSFEEIQAAYYMVAATGVLVAAIYYVMTLRATQRNMKTTIEMQKLQFFTSIYQQIFNEDGYKRYGELMNMEWKDYDDFEKKYGSDYNLENYAKRNTTWNSFNTLGILLRDGIVDIDTLYKMSTEGLSLMWIKFESVIMEQRRRYNGENFYANWEYLANELRKNKLKREPSYRFPETFIRYVQEK